MNDSDTKSRPAAKVIPRAEHGISRKDISENALKVLYRLKNTGHQAFLVGGGVRDVMLGLHPKDFDIVTDADPDEVRRLFRNSRLIGRRFRLAHVRFGRDIVEVATFRAAHDGEEHEDRTLTDSGRILRDNVYGTIDEDIWRRDFTVNALYYNIADFSVWDYTTGFEDIRSRTLRLIGDPDTRYREDPVRMLRAIRFAAKLGFEMAPETAQPIRELGSHLHDVPAARLFEEVLKLFQSGHGYRSFELLRDFGLLRYLFPSTSELLEDDPDGQTASLIEKGLRNTDRRIAEDQPVTPMFLYAVLLWPAIKRLSESLEGHGATAFEAMGEASHRVVAEQQIRTSLPKRFSIPMKEILAMQRRFLTRKGVRAQRLLEHKRFRAAYDFLLLRAETGEIEPEIADWWTEIQAQAPEDRKKSFGGGKRRRSKRGRRGRQAGQPEPDAAR